MPAFASTAIIAALAAASTIRPVAALNVADISGIRSHFGLEDVPENATFSSIKTTAIARSEWGTIGQNGQLLIPFSEASRTPVLSVRVGSSPVTTMNLVLDTGSHITWARSTLCESGNDCTPDKPMYQVPDNQKVVGANSNKKPRGSEYADGSAVQCHNVNDTVAIAHKSLSSHPICATTVSHMHAPVSFDGIIGLATFDGQEPTDIIGSFLKDHYPSDQTISFWYDDRVNSFKTRSPGPDQPKPLTPDAGEISLGKPNPERHIGEFAWMPVSNNSSQWETSFNSMTVNGKTISLPRSARALIDTGTSLIYLNRRLFDAINRYMQAERVNNAYALFCRRARRNPPITFDFGNHKFTMTWDQQVVDLGDDICLSVFAPNDLLPLSADTNLVGSSFIRTQYTSFDMKNRRIGFAQLVKLSSGTRSMKFTALTSMWSGCFVILILMLPAIDILF